MYNAISINTSNVIKLNGTDKQYIEVTSNVSEPIYLHIINNGTGNVIGVNGKTTLSKDGTSYTPALNLWLNGGGNLDANTVPATDGSSMRYFTDTAAPLVLESQNDSTILEIKSSSNIDKVESFSMIASNKTAPPPFYSLEYALTDPAPIGAPTSPGDGELYPTGGSEIIPVWIYSASGASWFLYENLKADMLSNPNGRYFVGADGITWGLHTIPENGDELEFIPMGTGIGTAGDPYVFFQDLPILWANYDANGDKNFVYSLLELIVDPDNNPSCNAIPKPIKDGMIDEIQDILEPVGFFFNALNIDMREFTDSSVDALGTHFLKSDALSLPLFESKLSGKQSVALLRTNPRITGNYKISVDSVGEIFLNSIDANPTLSNTKYKSFAVGTKLQSDIFNFLDNGGMDPEVFFSIEDKNLLATKDSFDDQYNMMYSAGAIQLKDKNFSEEFSYFAPLAINETLPEYFIICKVPHSLKGSDEIGDIISSSTIVQTVDLRSTSKIGKYIQNIVNDSMYKQKPLSVSFNAESPTEWHGISIEKGIMTTKSEFLDDFYKSGKQIKEFDEFITDGFMRNGIASTSILNLEFLFNDNTSDLYEINRYMGFYVSSNKLAELQISNSGMISIEEQIPTPRIDKDITAFTTDSFIQTNDNGIIISTLQNDKVIDNDAMDTLRILTIQDKFNNHYKIDEIEKNENLNIRIKNTKLDVTRFSGPVGVAKQLVVSPSNSNNSSMQLSIEGEIQDGETLIIKDGESTFILEANSTHLQPGKSWPVASYNETTKTSIISFSNEGSYENIAHAITEAIKKLNGLFTAFNDNESVLIVSNSYTDSLEFEYIPLETSNLDSLKMFGVRPSPTAIYASKNWCNIANDSNELMFELFTIITKEMIFASITLYDIKVYDRAGKLIYEDTIKEDTTFIYGNYTFNFIYAEINSADTTVVFRPELSKISEHFIGGTNLSNVQVKTLKSKIDGSSDSEWFQTKRSTYKRLKRYKIQNEDVIGVPVIENGVRTDDVLISLEDNNTFFVKSGIIASYFMNKIPFNVLSIFDTHDIDFDFFSSDYSKFPVDELSHYYNAQELPSNDKGTKFNLASDSFYHITYGGGEVVLTCTKDDNGTKTHESISLSESDIFNTLSSGSIPVSGVVFSDFSLYVNKSTSETIKLNNAIYLQDADLEKFAGFNSIKHSMSDKDFADFDKIKDKFDKFLYGVLLTEYDDNAENFNKEYALKSQITPFITKWVLDSNDVRDNSYRLNNANAFGMTGFSPDLFATKADPTAFTHEMWFLDETPQFFNKTSINEDTSRTHARLYDTIDGKTWEDHFSDTDIDWFSKYFTIGYPNIEFENELLIKEEQKLYSYIEYNQDLDESHVFFKGLRFNVSNQNEKTAKSLDDYKFTIIFSNQTGEPITFIQNDTFRFIVIIIKYNFTDYKVSADGVSYTLLYSSVSSLSDVSMTTLEQYKTVPILNYADFDVPLSIDWNTFITIVDPATHNKEQIIRITNLENTPRMFVGYDTRLQSNIGITTNLVARSYLKPMVLTSGDNLITISPNDTTGVGISRVSVKNTTDSQFESNQFNNSGNNERNSSFVKVSHLATTTLSEEYLISPSAYGVGNTMTLINHGYNVFETLSLLTASSVIESLESGDYLLIHVGSESEIKLSRIPNSRIEMNSAASFQEDFDIPKELREFSVVGFSPITYDEPHAIYRYGGDFSFKTTPVLTHAIRESDLFSNFYEHDFLNSNTRILNKEGVIKNIGYMKVAKDGILKLTSESSSKPLYPLIGEVAIDHKHLNILKSRWDEGVFDSYTSDGIKTSSMMTMGEDRAFFASKLMKIRNSINFATFTNEMTAAFKSGEVINNLFAHEPKELLQLLRDTYQDNDFVSIVGDESVMQIEEFLSLGNILVNPIENNDPILKAKLNSVIGRSMQSNYESADSINFTINIEERLDRFFIEDGASSEFVFINNEDNNITLDTDKVAAEYINANIKKLYKVKKVELLEKNAKVFDLILDKSYNELINQGFIVSKNFEINFEEDKIKVRKEIRDKQPMQYSIAVFFERI